MLPSLAKQVSSAASGTRQWQQRRQAQCQARSAARRYHRSAISLPHPPHPSTASEAPPWLSLPIADWRLLTVPLPPVDAVPAGGGVALLQFTSFSIFSTVDLFLASYPWLCLSNNKPSDLRKKQTKKWKKKKKFKVDSEVLDDCGKGLWNWTSVVESDGVTIST